MTENKRQEMLKDIREGYIDVWDNLAIDELFETIEKEHNEIQACRAIGTVEEIKALKEKSVAKKPLPKGTHRKIDNFYCPNCMHPLTNRHEQCELPYCDICGQKLDWSEH